MLCLTNEVDEIIVLDEVIVAVVDSLVDHRFRDDFHVVDEVDDEDQGVDNSLFSGLQCIWKAFIILWIKKQIIGDRWLVLLYFLYCLL